VFKQDYSRMNSSRRMVKALAALLPLGALGVSVALAATSTAQAAPMAAGNATQGNVANRLAAIRGAVSEIAGGQADTDAGDPNIQKAQWFNFAVPGWRNGGWNNWRNGPPWGNGGWHNWHNGWRNW